MVRETSPRTNTWLQCGKKQMPTYDIYVRCIHCGGEHPLLLKIFLANGPKHTPSIAEWFDSQSLSPQVTALKRHSALCLKTGKKVALQDEDKVFLVPLEPDKTQPDTYDC